MNFNWNILANENALNFLDKSLESNSIANFYIFSGIKDLGKFSLAKDFVKNIFLKDIPELAQKENFLDTNSDFFIIEREEDKKEISINQIRGLINSFNSSSFLNSYKIAIIKDAEYLNENSSNALLKLLEDFKNKIVIILTVNDLDNLAQTIISRAQVVNIFPVKNDLIYDKLIRDLLVSPSVAKKISRLSDGKISLALKFLQEDNFLIEYEKIIFDFIKFLESNYSERVFIIDNTIKNLNNFSSLEFLQIWQSFLRDLFFAKYGQYDFIRNEFIIDELKKIAQKNENDQKLVEKIKTINNSVKFLEANINFRSVLEYIAVNI